MAFPWIHLAKNGGNPLTARLGRNWNMALELHRNFPLVEHAYTHKKDVTTNHNAALCLCYEFCQALSPYYIYIYFYITYIHNNLTPNIYPMRLHLYHAPHVRV